MSRGQGARAWGWGRGRSTAGPVPAAPAGEERPVSSQPGEEDLGWTSSTGKPPRSKGRPKPAAAAADGRHDFEP